ncbi:response regulator [Marinobacter salinisoli]|uniref:histidine kinase n=1 Tax=Marinobacter salinisoli TaxID=2769486 RepID=A0ABX7MQT2_9GAMM|nr:response regulator [Marinobacter salinisoli]QSP94504.1 response regulator [Marinobacter salinisoli]
MPTSRLSKRLGIRPLAARLLVYVLLFSLIFSVVATGIQMLSELRRSKDDILASQSKTAQLVAGSLSHNLWMLNFSEVANGLDDILALNTIQKAQIVATTGSEFSAGHRPDGPVITQSFPLVFDRVRNQPPETVGTLTLTSSLAQRYNELTDRTLLNLLAQWMAALIGTLGLFIIVRLTLSRHLEAISDYASRLNLDALIAPLELKRKPPRNPDELSELEHALNTMRLQLLEDTRSLRQTTLQSQDERDEALRANHTKNQFLANISHELRIPLQSVLGYANLLADTPLDPEQREYVQTLLSASQGLSSIINDLLDISSIEAGKMVLDEIPFDLRDTLNDVIHMLGPRAREKGLALELRVDEDLPRALRGDPVRIRQVLLNLASNALKFTDSGHVLLSIEVLNRRENQARLRLSVEDTGIGISQDDIPLVCEPYVQLNQQFQRQLPGAGLGLSICRQLVSLMAGTLDLESQIGEGSTFWIELTLPVAEEKSRKAQPDTRMIRNRRVLVVDSYHLSRKITLEMLSRHKLQIEAVKSAGEALTSLRQAFDSDHPFDAIILDGFVPDMDSDLLCRQIRSNPDWSHLRLLILSSNPQRGDAEHFRQAGADAFLSKSLRESCLAPILNLLFADAANHERRFLTRFSLQTVSDGHSRPELPCRRMKVLLVEDNPVNRTLTSRLLEKLGCNVMTANDGEAAESLWQWHRFDLIFMDCVMPRVDGFEATRRLREWEQDQRCKPVPVVALTASAMEEDEERCHQAGMDSFVAKPVNIEMLRAVLEQYCKATAAF